MDGLDRRQFMKAAGVLLAAGATGGAASNALASTMFNVSVDDTLFTSINRAKDLSKMTPLESHHVPWIKAPKSVKPGEAFLVEVSIGKELHVTTKEHRIFSVTLLAGNEPIGTVMFESLFAQPRACFLVALQRSVTLVAQARCNLHGVWENGVEVDVRK